MNKIISLEIYPFDVMISVSESDKKFEKKMKRFGISKDEDYILFNLQSYKTKKARTVLLSNNAVCIRLKQFDHTPNCHGTLAHEIFHAIEFVFYNVGIKLRRSSDEAYAYCIGYLTEKIYEALERS